MITAAVVDASVAVKWVVNEHGSDRAQSLSTARLEAPDLLLIECANILWKKVRAHDLTRPDAASRLELLRQAPISLADSRSLLDAALVLSFDLSHPVYDCIYLALALAREVPLVTADVRLVAAARKMKRVADYVAHLRELSG